MTTPMTVKLKDAAKQTGLSKKVISQAIKRGEVEASKPGKEVLVYWESLQRFITRHRVKSA